MIGYFFQRKRLMFGLSLLWEDLTSTLSVYGDFQAQFTYLFNKGK